MRAGQDEQARHIGNGGFPYQDGRVWTDGARSFMDNAHERGVARLERA